LRQTIISVVGSRLRTTIKAGLGFHAPVDAVHFRTGRQRIFRPILGLAAACIAPSVVLGQSAAPTAPSSQPQTISLLRCGSLIDRP